MRTIEHKYEAREFFVPYHQRSQRWSILVCHRRFGKTVGSINDIVAKALYNDLIRPRYAYVAPYYSQAKQVAWDYLKYYTEGMRVGKPRESELSVELINGAVIRLYGADNPDALRGIYLDGVLLDEPAQMHPRVWTEVLRPTLSDRRGWATFIGTPKGHNFFFDIWQRAKTDPDNWFTLMAPASLTGILPKEELSDAKKEMSENEFAQEYECDFDAAIEGAYYGKEMKDAEKEGRIGDFKFNPSYRVLTAWDIGFDDETVIWLAQHYGNKIYLFDLMDGHHEFIEHYMDNLTLMQPYANYQYQRHILPHDAKQRTSSSSDGSVMSRFMQNRMPVRVIPRMSYLDQRTAARKILPYCHFNKEKVEVGIEGLKLYSQKFDKETKKWSEKPVHDWTSHYASAFHQLAFGLEETRPSDADRVQFGPTGQMKTLDELARIHDQQWAAQQSSGRI